MSRNAKDNRKGVAPQQRPLTQIDLEALRISNGATKFKGICDCVKSFVKWGSILGCAYFLYKSVESVVTGVAGIADRLADTLEAVCLRDFIYWIVIALLSGDNVFRRWRNRRLTKLVGDQRHEIEKANRANTRSGLDHYGEAAEDKE